MAITAWVGYNGWNSQAAGVGDLPDGFLLGKSSRIVK